jgi:gluconate 2-dehydrogenase gamma chain
VYDAFSLDEARFVEALVNILCPADELTPSGVECGLAAYIDAQLAGPFGRGARRYLRGPARAATPQHGLQLLATPIELFKAGIAAIERGCMQQLGRGFAALTPSEANDVLVAITEGTFTSDDVPLAAWFDALVYPLFVQGCFADPIHGGNRGAVFWKLIGYPGLPADYTEDFVRYRGKPYPREPRTIEDESS